MPKRERIVTYNGLRGIASLAILFSHMSYLDKADNVFWHGFWKLFMSKGAVCTTFFFLCSGFFLNYTWKNDAFKAYIIKKIKRIYPLTFIVLLMAIAVDILLSGNNIVSGSVSTGSSQWFLNILMNAMLLKAFIPMESVFYSFHGPSWYISALFWLYVFAYPLLRGLNSNNKEVWWKWIIRICASAYAIELIVCIVVQSTGLDSLWPCYVNPFFRIFGEGLAGVILCERMEYLRKKITNTNLVECTAVIVFFLDFLLRNILRVKIYSAWLQAIPMGLLLIAFRNGTGIISKVLKTKILQFMGDVSFELYMTHAFVYEGLPIVAGVLNTDMKSWLIIHAGTRFLITLFLSYFVAYIFSVIMRILINKIVN